MSLKSRIIGDKIIDPFLFLFLLSAGIIENKRYAKLELVYSAFVTSVSCVEILGNWVGFSNASEVVNRIEILIQVSAHVYFLSLHWILKIHKKPLLICAKHLRADSHDTSYEAVELTEQLFQKTVFLVLSIFILFMSMATLFSFFVPLLIEFDFNDKYIYVMPFWFTCTDSGSNYFPIKRLCWNIDSYLKYFVINSVEITLFLFGAFVYTTSFIFYVCFQTHTVAHAKVIISKIERMREEMAKYEQNIMARGSLREKLRREGIVCREFTKIVKYHQFIYNVEANIISTLCWIVSSSLSVFSAVSTFAAFVIVTEANSEKQGELMFRTKIASVIANAAVMFFFFCQGAEVTLNLNEKIHDAIYDIPWYSQSVKFKKLTISFMIQLQKALQISAFGMYKLNLNFYLTVCRTIYSMLNMLLIAFADVQEV